MAAVAAAFLPVEIAEDREDDSLGYTPPVLPPIEALSRPPGSVVPFRRQGDVDASTSEGASQAGSADGGGSVGQDDTAAQIEAVLPDGVLLRLPDDVAPERLAALVQALRS